MKVKTSITLSEDLIAEVDRVAGPDSRSAFIERVLRSFLTGAALQREQEHDRHILDRSAEALNEEAEEVLAYQVRWESDTVSDR
jgi:metal-responsive CopG/Arc/MetJ family transcriptional regulator